MKTPGGKLVYQHLKKLATSPKCGDCGIALPGVSPSISASSMLLILLRSLVLHIGPRAPSSSICDDFQAPKDCTTGIWWQQVWRLREATVCPRLIIWLMNIC